MRSRFLPESFSHSLTGNTSTEINVGVTCFHFWFNALFLCTSCWPPFCSLLKLFYSPCVPVLWKLHQQMWTCEEICDFNIKWDWPSTGGVHEECNQSGGGRTNTVKSQHGVLELFLTHNMIWKQRKRKSSWTEECIHNWSLVREIGVQMTVNVEIFTLAATRSVTWMPHLSPTSTFISFCPPVGSICLQTIRTRKKHTTLTSTNKLQTHLQI